MSTIAKMNPQVQKDESYSKHSGWLGYREKSTPFKDTWEHLSALEFEAEGLLALAAKRAEKEKFGFSGRNPGFGAEETPKQETRRFSLKEIEALVSDLSLVNRSKEALSRKAGIQLYFEDICVEFGLDSTERKILLFLFVHNVSQDFRNEIVRSGFESNNVPNNGLSVGTLLQLVSSDFLNQVRSRAYFSVSGRLAVNELIVGGFQIYNERDSVLGESVCLHQRVVNFILGDHNIYSNEIRFISKTKPTIKPEQVILPERVKEAILESAENYARVEATDTAPALKRHFGYGTGLSYLFYGPSGTGKTMMAHAVASHLGKTLFVVNMDAAQQGRFSVEDIIKYAFKEARLCNGILFFDECDEIFTADTYDNMIFITEIEKSECITIMTTNRHVALDPALDRRVSMKVQFSIPSKADRERIWNTLMPPEVEIDKKIDFKALSRRYVFTGGIIKNTILSAVHGASSKTAGAPGKLYLAEIELAANRQAFQIFEKEGLGKLYQPGRKASDLPLSLIDRKSISRLAICHTAPSQAGIDDVVALMIDDIDTGIACAEAMAEANGQYVRLYNSSEIFHQELKEESADLANLGRTALPPLAKVFMPKLGHNALTVFVDDEDEIAGHFSEKNDSNSPVAGFLRRLKRSTMHICIVSRPFKIHRKMNLPFRVFEIGYPIEETQLQCWMKHLEEGQIPEPAVLHLVEAYPMHLLEIERVCTAAKAACFIENRSEIITVRHVEEEIKRRRTSTPDLFAGQA